MSLDPFMKSDRQLEIVRSLDGVRYAFYLDDATLLRISEEEAKVRASGNIPVDNKGLTEALQRECVICIIKSSFRPPPEPTVILQDANGQRMGEEVFPWTMDRYKGREDVVWLFDSFVLFPNVKAEGGQYFVMPPVSFPELNETNGCRNVISCSPAPTSDKLIREAAGMPVDTSLASILVAFDRIPDEGRI